MDSIRESIETHRHAGYGSDRLVQLWHEGNLIPRDEHEAAVSEAVMAEMERCAAIAESQILDDEDPWCTASSTARAIAAAIRDSARTEAGEEG